MSFQVEERTSDSSYIETIIHGCTVGSGTVVRPSEVHWHLVFTKFRDTTLPIFVGPLTSAGEVSFIEGAEILWVKFQAGTFMPDFLPKDFRDAEVVLPEASHRSFWLKNSTWEIPDFENVETFVAILVRTGMLVRDDVVRDVLEGQRPVFSRRTLRHRFRQATGLTQIHFYQAERARQAEELLQQGETISEIVYKLGYYDQPHLTRSLKQYIGYTPGQIAQTGTSL